MCTDEITVSLSLDRIGSPCYIFSNKGFQMHMTDLQISKNPVQYINEPYVTGGNPILANDKVLFNDMLGTTLGIQSDKYEPIQRDAFGMVAQDVSENFFTGKPYIGELGYAFLFRNYRAEQGKWQTQDPLGYPDGWNNLRYANNYVTDAIDAFGASVTYKWGSWEIDKIIGVDGTLASGYMYGNSVIITWKITITWTCTDCNKSGTKSFYDATRYSNNDVVWSAPKAGLGLSVPTATTLPGLVGELLASQLDDLIGKSIASGLSKSHIQDSKALIPPSKRPTFTHKCE